MKLRLTDKALPEKLPSWGVLVLESHHSPQFAMEWRTHPFMKVVYVLNGDGTFYFENRSSQFSAGDVIIVPPRTKNRFEDDPTSAASLYVCCIATSLLSFDLTLVGRFKTQTIRSDGHFANRAASLMRRMVHVQGRADKHCSVAMVADAIRLVQIILERKSVAQSTAVSSPACNQSPQRELMARYVTALQSEFFEATTIDAAAETLSMSRRTFTKLFAEATGETWLQYLRRLAIEHAMQRLLSSDLPIASIAFECGFNDLSTFYRQFKSQIGLSPAAYRNQSRA